MAPSPHTVPPMLLPWRSSTAAPLRPVTAHTDGTAGCRVLEANKQAVFCTLRTRLCCEVFDESRRVSVHHAFNEACMDRGLALNFLQLDCYIDGSYVTTIQVRPRHPRALCCAAVFPKDRSCHRTDLLPKLAWRSMCVRMHALAWRRAEDGLMWQARTAALVDNYSSLCHRIELLFNLT